MRPDKLIAFLAIAVSELKVIFFEYVPNVEGNVMGLGISVFWCIFCLYIGVLFAENKHYYLRCSLMYFFILRVPYWEFCRKFAPVMSFLDLTKLTSGIDTIFFLSSVLLLSLLLLIFRRKRPSDVYYPINIAPLRSAVLFFGVFVGWIYHSSCCMREYLSGVPGIIYITFSVCVLYVIFLRLADHDRRFVWASAGFGVLGSILNYFIACDAVTGNIVGYLIMSACVVIVPAVVGSIMVWKKSIADDGAAQTAGMA